MRPKIRIVTPSSRSVNPYTVSSLSYNLWEVGRQGIDIDAPRLYDEYPLSRARNIALREFVESDCTHMFSWDDDSVFPMGTLLKLIQAEQPIVSSWYLSRKGNLGLVVFGRKPGKQLLDHNDFNYYYPMSLKELFARRINPSTPLAKVDGVGLGGILITHETAEKLLKTSAEVGKPAFAEWHPYFDSEDVHTFGEDLWFADFCAYVKIPLYVHLKAFIGHWAAQGFVIGTKHLQSRAMQEGIMDFKLVDMS